MYGGAVATMLIDTLRVVIDWRCNLSCWYCCNEQDSQRSQFGLTSLSVIDFSAYKNVCITGGEPFLFPDKIREVAALAHAAGCYVIVYTNGILLSKERLDSAGPIDALTVGLHLKETFAGIIAATESTVCGTKIKVRYNVNQIFSDHPVIVNTKNRGRRNVRFFFLNQCDRHNERRVVLDTAIARTDFKPRDVSSKYVKISDRERG